MERVHFSEVDMPRVSEEYYEMKKKEIIDAAYRVCLKKPITAIEMKDVIAEAGFSHGVIYRYYKDLDEVLSDLVIRINTENRLDGKVEKILSDAGIDNWEKGIRDICSGMADYLQEVGFDLLKVTIYCDVLAMSDPERVLRIAEKLGNDVQSPLLYLVNRLSEYLTEAVKKNKLKPVKSIKEIMEFFIASYHGIQTGYVLTESYKAEHIRGNYKPTEMFSCLAESMILMMGGR